MSSFNSSSQVVVDLYVAFFVWDTIHLGQRVVDTIHLGQRVVDLVSNHY